VLLYIMGGNPGEPARFGGGAKLILEISDLAIILVTLMISWASSVPSIAFVTTTPQR